MNSLSGEFFNKFWPDFGEVFDQIFGQVFDQIFGQVFDQGFLAPNGTDYGDREVRCSVPGESKNYSLFYFKKKTQTPF